jgi:sarcosine oxidase subunit beta
MSSGRFDAILIGGGLHGLSAALHLAREGQSVLILERSWIGRHASGASAAGVRTLGAIS